LQIGNFQFPIFNPAKADDFAVAAKLDNFVSRHLNTELAHPPRVAYVIKMFPRLSETFILNEVLELERQGVALHIFSLKRPADSVTHAQAGLVRSPVTYLPERFRDGPLRVTRGQLHVWRRYPRAWRRTVRNLLRRARAGNDAANWALFYQACCLIREMGDIRHLHAHYANIPAKVALLVHRLCGASYSITTHAKDIFQNDPFASPKLQERLCRASFVVANSRFSAEHIRGGLNGQGNIHVIYNGLDLQAFPLRRAMPEQPLILAVGRLVEKKGFVDLITACQLLKQKGIRFNCEIIGTGVCSSQLKEEIRARGVGELVRLVGPLPQQELRQHYGRAMVFALPCLRAADGDRDILPNVIKEAMAVGVPVITTRLEAIEELIEDGVNGLLVEPKDPAALAQNLELLLGDAQLRQRLAPQARSVIEQGFDRRSNFGKLKTLLLQFAIPRLESAVCSPQSGDLTPVQNAQSSVAGAQSVVRDRQFTSVS
jgi:colanic acid/amylovoran biosynthesis glycosyltransferase